MIAVPLLARGIHGTYSYIPEEGIYYGKLHTKGDLVTFEGDTAEEAERAFIEAVDGYCLLCEEVGKSALTGAKISPTPGTKKDSLKSAAMIVVTILAIITIVASLVFAALNLLGWN